MTILESNISRYFFILLIFFGAISFLLTHLLWPLTLPIPWPDETHFLIPAISLDQGRGLTADRMLVHQIYWIPVGSYIFNGLTFLIAGQQNIYVARGAAFFCIVIATILLRDNISVALGAPDRERPAFGHALALAWFISLPVVFAADLARPDALALLLSFAALACVLRGRLIGGLGFAGLAIATHPLLAWPACVAVASAGAYKGKLKIVWWEWVALAVAAAVLSLEAYRLVTDFDAYRAQWVFQISRKTGRSFRLLAAGSGLGVLLALAGLYLWPRPKALEARRRVTEALSVFAFALACVLVYGFGQEMWYYPFILAGLALSAAALIGILSPTLPIVAGVHHGAAAPALIAAIAISTWLPGLRPTGLSGFDVNPSDLPSLASDVAFLDGQIRDALKQQNARRVIVSPYLFNSFLGDKPDAADMRTFTWGKLSEPQREHFDHAVVLIASSASMVKDDPQLDHIRRLFADYACKSETRIVSPNGHYVVAVLGLEYRPSAGGALSGCH